MALQFEIGLRLTDKELKSQLADINKDLTRAFTVRNSDGGFAKEIAAAATQAKALEKALANATTNKGISYAQLNLELAKAGTTAGKLTSTLAQGGTYFRQSLDSANNALALSNRHVLSLNRTLQEAARVFRQSFKFTVAQTAIRAISTEFRESVQWVTNLNDAINNIAVVTGKTAGQITNVTNQAISGSKELRVAAEDYAKGALVFYQQGLNDEEVIRRNEITIKAAKAANQSIDEMSKQLTAIWNTYSMTGEEQMRAASVGAKMAASTAVNFADIAEAMQQAAAPAAQMGVEYNQLAAIIATVGDATQQSASIIGNAYKTIFSRFQQLVSDGTDGEVTLGEVSKKLQNLGVQLLNSDGSLKNLGTTINEVGHNWNNWSQEQQLAIAQLVGGTRQYGQFLSLMQNFDKYQKNLTLAAGETGQTLEQQYTQYLDSIESRAESAGEAWHRAFSNLITADEIKSAYSAVENFGDAVDNVLQGLGGLPGIFSMVAVLLSSKIIPALQVAGKSAISFGASLVGKQGALINKDFNDSKNAISSNATLSSTERDAALAKNEFSRQTAIINEQINAQLSRATGLRKTELEMQQQQLAETQKSFTATVSESQALDKKLQNQLNFYNQEEVLMGESIHSLETKAAEESAYIELLQKELQILEEQAKQKTIIKNRPQEQGGNVIDDHRYEGTANERRRQNASYIADTKSKLGDAQDRLTETNLKIQAEGDANVIAEKSAAKLTVAYGKLQKALADYQRQQQAGAKDSAAKSMEDAKNAAGHLVDGLTEVSKVSNLTDEQLKEFKKVLSMIDDGADLSAVSDQLHNIGEALLQVSTEGENATNILTQGQQSAVKTANELGEATGLLAKRQQEQAMAAITAMQRQKATASEAISLTVQLGSAAAMAVNSIRNIIEVWKNPDLSDGERMLQLMTAMSSLAMFTLPTITSVVKKLQEFGLAALTTAAAEEVLAAAEDEATRAALAEAAAEAANAKAKETSGLAALKAGLMAQTALGPVWLVIVGITAAVVALTAAFMYLYSEAKNKSLEEQLNRARAAAEALAEAEEQAKQEAEKLRSTMEKYDSAVDKLNQCTIGTQEWRDALQEVNTAALEVLNNLPTDVDISNAYSRNSDGMIELNKDAIDAAQANLDKRVSSTSYASAMGNVRVQEAQVALDAESLAKSLNAYQYHYVPGASAGTQDNSNYQADQGVETIRRIIEENAEQLKGLTDEEFRPALEEMGVIMTNISDDELAKIKTGLGELGVAAEQAREKLQLVAKLMVDEQLGDKYDGDTKDAIAKRMAGVEDLRVDELKNWMTGDAFNKADPLSDAKAIEDLVKMFSDAMGGGYSKAGNFVRGTDTNRSFAFLKDGEEVEYRAQEIAEIIAAAEALGGLEENAQKVAETFNGLNDKIEKNDENSTNAQAAKSFLTDGNLNSLTDKQLQDIVGLSDEDLVAMLMDTFGLETAEEFEAFAKEWGFESSEALINGFKGAEDISVRALEDVGKSLTSSTRKVFDNIAADGDLTITAKQHLESTLKQIFNDFGAEGLADFEDIIQEMGNDAGTFLDNIGTIDWDSASPESLETELEKLGIKTDKLSKEQLQTLINALKKVGEASLDAAREYNKNLNDAASSVKENNSIISDEDYQKLQEAGVNVNAFFQDMGDGTHQLTADADAFKQMVHDIQMGKLEEAQQNAITKQDSLGKAQEWVNHVDEWTEGSTTQTGAMALALKESGQVDNTTFEGWKDDGWVQNAEVAEKVRQAYADAGMSSEKIKEMMNDAAVEAERAQQAMDNAEFAFEVESAGLDLDETTRYAERLKKAMLQGKDASKLSKDEMRLYEKAAQDAAIANQRLDRGIGNLKKNLDDYKKALKESNKGTAEWSEAMDSLKSDIADITGIDDFDLLSDDFAEQTLASEDLKKALEGDVEAVLRLQAAAADDIIINVVANQADDPEEIRQMWTQLKLDFEAMDLSAPGVDQTDLINSFNDMISKGKMTKDQIEAALAGLHVSANVKTTYNTSTEQVPIQAEEQWWEPNPSADQTVPIYDDNGEQTGSYKKPAYIKKTKAWVSGYEEAQVSVPSYEIEGTTDEGGVTTAFIDAPAPTPSKGGTSFSDNPSSKSSGGGGGGSTKAKEFKKKDKVEKDDQKYHKRYENLTNAIEELNDALKHTASAQNDAWGNAKLRQMDTYILKVQKLAKVQKALIQETKDYYKKDKAALLATSVGSMAKFDDGEYGDLLNPEDLRRTLQARYEEALEAQNAAIEAYNLAKDTADGADAQVEAQKELYDEMVKSLDKDIKALDQFLETRDLLRERMEQQLDYIRDWMSKKVEKIQYEIDMRIRIPQRDIKQLERFISRVEDIGIETDSSFAAVRAKWDKTIESMQATWGNDGTDGEVKSGIYRALEILENIDPNNPEHQAYFEKTFGKEAWQEYLKDTSAVPEVVIDKIHDLYDQLLDYQEQLYDIAQETFDMLARKIEMWFEKLDKIQDRLDTHLTRLEMLQSIVDASNIAGSQAGRDATRQINESKKKNAWTSAHVSEATYLGAKQVYEDLDKQYNEILAERNALGEANADNMEEIKAYEFVLKNLKNERDKAYEDMTAAEQERNQKIGEAASMMKEMLNQEFDMLTTEFEIGLNGLFATLEGAIQMFDDMAEVRDWYLDPFEKDYEFQSLLNKIDKEIEGTNDPEYLKKLMDMRQKIIEKQAEGRDITQEEFNIDNKRFELLQAQAAFEEAQNAKNKNTMRLQRDASGNYSYVYSDDEKQADDLKQKVLDAEHNLYEAEKNAERAMDKLYYQQLQKIEQLRRKRAEALAEGNMEVVAECDRLIELATITLDRIAADEGRFSDMLREDFGDTAAELNKSISAMIADYDTLSEAEEVHKNKLIEYEDQMTAATQQMQADMERELQELGIDYKNLAQTVKTETDNINRENEEMKQKVTEMKTQGLRDLSEYTNAINSWARNFISQMQAIIQKLKELIKAIEEAEKKAASANLDPNSDIMNTDWQAKIIDANKRGDYDAADEYTANRDKKDELMGGDYISSHGYMSQDMNRAINEAIRNGDLTGQDQDNVNTIINAYARAKGDANKLFEYLKNIDVGTVRNTIASQTGKYSGLQGIVDFLAIVKNLKADAKIFEDKGWADGHVFTGGLISQNGVYELAEKGPELVLNADDTEKILQAVKLMRGTVQMQMGAIDTKLFTSAGKVAEITPYIPPVETDSTGVQEVHIEANFPGVSVASEIEDALNSLVVQAAQYQSKYHR